MKHILSIAVLVAGTMVPGTGFAALDVSDRAGGPEEIVEHGGGCRKSSPPGQCCHMDKSTGSVHCH
ncbi:hypothetical protein SAMN05444398_101182 [Roseovarius pacificus]|uniref:YHYH domain-containing protein n=1 Tax=Roseovarius pacificus TaxID=337701 RepID=A0A1M6WX69_9RHOB|nr:hypothetical protein SAMN05444398_101182 [Roseovarius pacificus]